jgi:fructose-bisphosphate aldolase class II
MKRAGSAAFTKDEGEIGMAFVTMTDILKGSNRGWALGSFITFNMEMTEAIFEAAEAEKSPLIIMIYLPYFEQHGRALVPMIRSLAENATVPVCLHLDHGQNMEQIVHAIKAGFTSVMIDASVLPLEENIALARKAVEFSHLFGVSVEAELGHVPGGEQFLEQEKIGEKKTDPGLAARYVDETGIDALAIAVGNLQGGIAGSAHIDIDRIARIRQRTSCLLVLHGGTALTDEEVRLAIETGVDKINYFTNLRRAYSQGLLDVIKDDPDSCEPIELMDHARGNVVAIIRQKMRLFGSSHKAL